jgi:putative acetyltransferase
MVTRLEETADEAAVHALNAAAFPTSAEADLVDALRARARPIVSLVAVEGSTVVGHILFSPVSLAGLDERFLMGLAPMAIAPARQRRGIGSQLVRAGLQACGNLGCGAVVVLGHPDYYPRFGFMTAARRGLMCEYDAPDDAFMVLELRQGYLDGAVGMIRYHPAFDAL